MCQWHACDCLCHSCLIALDFLNQLFTQGWGVWSKGSRSRERLVVTQASCFHNCKAFFFPTAKKPAFSLKWHTHLLESLCRSTSHPKSTLVTNRRFPFANSTSSTYWWCSLCTSDYNSQCWEVCVWEYVLRYMTLCVSSLLSPIWLLFDFSHFWQPLNIFWNLQMMSIS